MANEDILSVIEEAISQYRPGGAFSQARAGQLAEKKATVIPKMYSGLISSGLGGTTVRQTVPTRFESEIAKPFETETELLRTQRLMEAIMAKAGILQKQEEMAFTASENEKQRELQQKLAEGQITANEYMAQLAASRAGGGGNSGGTGWPPFPEETTTKTTATKQGPISGADYQGTEYGLGAGPTSLIEPGDVIYMGTQGVIGEQPSAGASAFSSLQTKANQTGQRQWYEYGPSESLVGKPVVAGTRGYWVYPNQQQTAYNTALRNVATKAQSWLNEGY
jgi:hypothetical protein